ncbi:hypothetical protein SAMN02910339_02014 [Lachnospiraceae bacterium YSD2013]|jgi:predicted aldo/keto reductase-like oxidoreductase|nr:aldo/keto reductase [Lachnospiraceae bacterium]SCX14565.1 hypothetical protein SAMN02910339_02014 [Lachnospiraceae bacterium YSD2013]
MEYRELKNGYKSSLLGYGCMRLPLMDDGQTVNEVETEKLLMKAYKNGVNYFDTAWPYHGGQSERVVGKIMKQLPRESFYLATKMPAWFVNSLEEAEKVFKEQLEHLQTDYIDFYLLHAMNRGSYDKLKNLGIVDMLQTYKDEGKIKNYGFSFHDDYDAFEYIIKDREWDFCQIQFNYVDKDTQATMKGYELAKELGVPLIIMEPVKGGNLASIPKDVIGPMDEFRPGLTPAAWALSWVGTFDNVKVILSGMTTMEQLDDNLATFKEFKPLSDAEMAAMEKVNEEITARSQNGCTGCKYCMPCPKGVNIPRNFAIWNNYHKFMNRGGAQWEWSQMPEAERPYSCVKCGKCETMCPQKINIRDDLEKVGKEMKELFS